MFFVGILIYLLFTSCRRKQTALDFLYVDSEVPGSIPGPIGISEE
jgi:hypothetical protein